MGKSVFGRWTVSRESIPTSGQERGFAYHARRVAATLRVLGSGPTHAARDPRRRVEQGAGDVPARALDPGDEVGPELGAAPARRPSPFAESEEEPVSQARRAEVLSRAAGRTAGRADLRADRHRLRQAV